MSRLRPGIAGVLLAALVVLAFANTINAPFVFDDEGAILHNPTIRRLASLAVLSPPADGSTTTGRPLVNVSLAVNHAISGTHPWSYHAANILIHVGCALLLFGLVRRQLLRTAPARSQFRRQADYNVTWVAFVAAALWALHPLQTETVACTAQRTESLCGLFYLLTLYAFVRGTAAASDPASATASRRAPLAWLVMSVMACLLGMATKEVMVTAPVVVWLFDRTFVAGTFRAAWRRRRGYYVGLGATWLMLAFLLVRSGGARGAAAGFGRGVSSGEYLLKQSEAIAHYLKLALWPHPLVLDYGASVPASWHEVALPLVVVIVGLVATAWLVAQRPVAGFFAAGFAIVLSPSSSFVPLVTQTMAEHRMYLPLAFVCIGAVALAVRVGWRGLAAAGASLVVGFGLLTARRNETYRDPVVLWSDSVRSQPAVPRAQNNLALALEARGRLREANEHFARAVALDPAYVTGHYDWGVALLTAGRIPDAIRELERARTLAPNHADARVNLGAALVQAGRARDAIPEYEAALAVRPAADAEFDLGVALVAVGRNADAATHLRAALALDPQLASAHRHLARLAQRAGDAGGAQREYEAALAIAPGDAAAHASLGVLLAQAGQLADAERHLRAAVRLEPDNADAQANLGNVLLLLGRPSDALACYQTVLRLRPDDARIRENIAAARAALDHP